MDFEIKKTVRSAVLSNASFIEWALGQGVDKELFEDPKLEMNDYVQNFDGWTIGMDAFEGEENFPIFARIDWTKRVFVYGRFTQAEDDWGAVQDWFLEQTGIELGPLRVTTQTVTVDLNAQVDLPATAKNMGIEFDPSAFPALVFSMESELIHPENEQSVIYLFGSGKLLFAMLHGNLQQENDFRLFEEMVEKIRSDIHFSTA